MSIEIALERIAHATSHNETLLDLSNLGLKELPSEIAELKQLTHLYLEKNELSVIDYIKPLNQLTLISLEDNQLTKIPLWLLELRLPITLKVGNLLSPELRKPLSTKFKPITNLTKSLYDGLDKLIDVSIYSPKNKLNHERVKLELEDLISCIENFLKTHNISVTEKAISELQKKVAKPVQSILTKVNHKDYPRFDLENDAYTIKSNLQTILPKLWPLESSGIYIGGNPLDPPLPPEVLSQGNDGLRAFLESYVESDILNEVKVILVGDGAAGKTSLVKRLLNLDFDKKEPQTHGIKILQKELNHGEWSLGLSGQSRKKFTVNFWDFGGQEVMHATHQFFLTKRCLYLLVLDSRKDEMAEYWLNFIQSFGGDSPVIIVINKTDQNPTFDLDRNFLMKKYSNIIEFYRVSCLNKNGIDQLREYLIEKLWNLELRETAFPRSWLKVKRQLENITDDYISYKKFQVICNHNHVENPKHQRALLELLNDLGVVLNYEKLRYYNTQVLNPVWLTNAVYRIINSPIVANSNGRFRIQELDAIINDERYQKSNPEHWSNIFRFWKPEKELEKFPEHKFLFVVAMMNQFELLYEIQKGYFLLPELLPTHQNTVKLSSESQVLSFAMEYDDFLPSSIIPRLMVKMHKYVFDERVWKTGMVLEEKTIFKSKANIVLDKEKRTLYIDIQGRRNRDFLTMIRETVKDINNDYEDVQVTEWIPLPEKYRGETLLVDYQELLGYEDGKQETFYSGKLRKAFSVADLLNGIEKPELRQYLKPLNIFISYSHNDDEHKSRLKTCLMPLVRLNKATLWDDAHIDAGEDWNEEIFSQLEKADIVLCVISANFIGSEFCYSKELGAALEAHEKGEKVVIPIRARETNWDKLDIAKLQGLPGKWFNQNLDDDKSWTEVSKGIEKVINKLQKG